MQSRSFKEYVRNNLDNQMWNAIEDYLASVEPSTLDLRLNKVRNVGEMELYDTELQFVDVSDLPGAAIKFDVVMDATIIVYDEDRYHNDESEAKHVLIVTDARVIFDSESRLSCNIGKRLLVDLSDKQATKWSVRKLHKTTIYCGLSKEKRPYTGYERFLIYSSPDVMRARGPVTADS